MSTRYYDLPGIKRVSVHETTVSDRFHMHIEPDSGHPDVAELGPLTIVGEPVDCLRLFSAWAKANRHTAAYRSNGVIRVTSTQPDAHPAISEYGDLTTVGALRRGEAP